MIHAQGRSVHIGQPVGINLVQHFRLELCHAAHGRNEAVNAVGGYRLLRLRQHAARRGSSRNLPATATTAAAPDGAASAEGWELLGKCAAEYAGLAETADSQAADLRECQAYGGAVSK
nr:MAG TPA: Protein of unknown function (DUF2514) [Caudoviricetes sp.]